MTGIAPFDTARFAALQKSRGLAFGEPLVHSSETRSTNDDALLAAGRGVPEGAVFVADAQTEGRGRRGRAWVSPPGENLTFSLLLRPPLSAERASALSLVAGLAVRAAAARRVQNPIGIKWPNDVVAGTRKLAGILVESRVRGVDLEAIVIGFGVNVHTVSAPAEIESLFTSLALLGDPAPDRESLLGEILAELEERLSRFYESGLGALLDELRAADALLGSVVEVGEVEGAASGIDEQGALLVRDAAGTVHAVTSGTVVRK